MTIYTWTSDGNTWLKSVPDVQSTGPCVLVSIDDEVYAWTGGVGTSHAFDSIDDAMRVAFGEP